MYSSKPSKFFNEIKLTPIVENSTIFCAGYELGIWRHKQYAEHLMEWLTDYALIEDELKSFNSSTGRNLTKQAANRVYKATDKKPVNKRGEIGEISLHAVCRYFFDTIPFVTTCYFKSATNDTVKGFDLIHTRLLPDNKFEIWFGESKFYTERNKAIESAIISINKVFEDNYFQNEKIWILSKQKNQSGTSVHVERLFESNVTIDELLKVAVFVIGIVAESEATKNANDLNDEYFVSLTEEINIMAKKLFSNKIKQKVNLKLIYIPLGNKKELICSFDAKLNGIQK
ncbi:MAG: DUF1837 domain-containing protein [Cyclobacteriaceae bacterium]|nr:DUF1837 domain-containing protein [Cyclobacteriaceae bacterium]